MPKNSEDIREALRNKMETDAAKDEVWLESFREYVYNAPNDYVVEMFRVTLGNIAWRLIKDGLYNPSEEGFRHACQEVLDLAKESTKEA